MKKKKKDYKWYARVFEDEMREGREIYNSKGELLEIDEDEEFKQCYDPSDPRRAILPYSWFLSNKSGNVISVKPNKDLIWLLRINNASNYEEYKFTHPKTKKIKNIKIHNLVGLVWGAKEFGLATDYLNESDLYAIGDKSNLENVNGHHKKSIKDYPKKQFDPDNIEFMTVRAHKILHNFPDDSASLEKKKDFVIELNQLADIEAPGKVIVVTGGEEKEIFSIDDFWTKLSPESKKKFAGIVNAFWTIVNTEQI